MKKLFNTYTAVSNVATPELKDIPKVTFNSYDVVKDNPISIEIEKKEDTPTSTSVGLFDHLNPSVKKITTSTKKTYKNSKGLSEFNKYYDEVEKEMPEAKQYRSLLTDLANAESSFNSSVQNSGGAPAYGYFQFMQDGVKYNNITHYAGVDIDTFRNDPKLQIKAAIKLAQEFKNTFSDKDREIAKKQGITEKGLLSGAWLAGVGGVREYLYGKSDKSDGYTSVSQRIKELNT